MWSLAIAILILANQASRATIIIFYADKDQILAGSDGLIKMTDGQRTNGSKIFSWDDKIAGVVGLLNDGRSYDTRNLIDAVFRDTNSPLALDAAVNKIESVCSNSLVALINTDRGKKMADALNGPYVLQLGFAGFVSNSPAFYVRRFLITTNSLGAYGLEVERATVGFDPRAPLRLGMGQLSPKTVSLLGDGTFWKKQEQQDPSDGVLTEIRGEIAIAPDEVGPPIYLIRLPMVGQLHSAESQY
jgi:hypothetical protein